MASIGMGVALLMAGMVSGASAQVDADPFDCDAHVVDLSGEVDVAEVEAVIAETNHQMVVVVRALDTFQPMSDLDQWVDDFVALCAPGPGDQPRSDLALLAFSLEERSSSVLLGSDLPGGGLPQDLIDIMGSRFADGDFTGGLTEAIIHLSGFLDPADPVTQGDPVGGRPEPSSSRTDGGQSSPGQPERGGLGGPIGGGLVVGALGIGGGGVVLWRRRRLLKDRQHFQARSVEPLSRATSARQRARHAETSAKTWAVSLTGESLEVLNRLSHQVHAAGLELDRAVGMARAATPEGVAKASRQQLAEGRKRLAELESVEIDHGKQVDRLVAYGAHLDHLRVSVPTKRELLFDEVIDAISLADTRRAEGWDVRTLVHGLETVKASLNTIDLNELALDLLAISAQVEQGEADLVSIEHKLQSLPDRVGALGQWHIQLGEAISLEQRRIEASTIELSEVARVHAPESWQWASGLPDEGRRLIKQATDQLIKVKSQLEQARSDQALDALGAELELAGLHLAQVDSYMDQVEDLFVDLAAARHQGAGLINECRQILGQFSQFVSKNRPDLTTRLSSKPSQIEQVLQGLEADLGRARPNYLRVAQTAGSLNVELDSLLAEATEQKAARDALRRQLGRAIAGANSAISQARRSLGWNLFGSGEGRHLDQLEQSMARLSDMELNEAITEANQIASEALVIHERIIARRRRQGNWVVVGSGGGWSSGGGSSSPGGSLGGSGGGGGISFGGGGGGISFGGGGRASGSW